MKTEKTISITGYQIREALKRACLRREIASQLFDNSIFAFEGEQKQTPKEVIDQFVDADLHIARLQALQQVYNQTVQVQVGDDTMSLAIAVKLVGGAGRAEKMWRTDRTYICVQEFPCLRLWTA